MVAPIALHWKSEEAKSKLYSLLSCRPPSELLVHRLHRLVGDVPDILAGIDLAG